MRPRAWLLAMALVSTAIGGLATVAAQPIQDSTFVASNPHATAQFPSDPVRVVDETRGVASATCGVTTPFPLPPPSPIPDLTDAFDGVGGDCFLVTPYADDAKLTVSVQRVPGSVPENREHFAVGYDLDDDGCVGCTPADALWKDTNQLQIPVIDSEAAFVVFVYGATTNADPQDGGGPVETALFGDILVEQTGTTSVACEQTGPSEQRCGIPLDQPRPHLCVPTCMPVIDQPETPTQG